jgi:hypothetical protein
MNTKTNAPAEVAQLDKGADKSPKQAAVQTVQAIKPADPAAHETKKGIEVATAEKTLDQLMQERAALDASIKEMLGVERPNALARLKAEIALYTFTAKELGFSNAAAAVAPAEASTTPPAEIKERKKAAPTLKSAKSEATSVWLNFPPKFITDEKVQEVYEQGKPIDAWLVNPEDGAVKLKILKKFWEKSDHKVQPNKAQLGEKLHKDFKAFTK